jgi:hypothetical protein
MSYIIEYYFAKEGPGLIPGWYRSSLFDTYKEAKEDFERLRGNPSVYKYRLRNTETNKIRGEFEHPDLNKSKPVRKKRKYTRKKKT